MVRRVVCSFCCLFGLCAGAFGQARSIAPARERGLASWYGAPYSGRSAASGEIYNQDELTAAHRTLPFGTRVRVHRVDERTSVVVRINDRGPFIASRIIDLSRAAAARLGMTRQGVVPVSLEIVESPPRDPNQAFSVDLSSLSRRNAVARHDVLSRASIQVRAEHRAGDNDGDF